MMKTNYHRESWIVNFQAVWLTQPQSEPSLHLEKWIPAKDLVARSKIFYPHFCVWKSTWNRNWQLTRKSCPGEGDLQQNSGTKSILHLIPGQPNEEETQGWPSCHKDHGEIFYVDLKIQRSPIPHLSGERLQRLGGGHCCCQYLFWQGNCHG